MTDIQALGVIFVCLATMTVIETILARLWEQHRDGMGVAFAHETNLSQFKLLLRNFLSTAFANFCLSVPVLLLVIMVGRDSLIGVLKDYVFGYKVGLPSLMLVGLMVAASAGTFKSFIFRKLRHEQYWRSISLGFQGGVAWTWLVYMLLMFDWRGAANLVEAVSKNNVSAVRNMLSQQSVPAEQLQAAWQQVFVTSNLEVAGILLKSGAKLDWKDANGKTVLERSLEAKKIPLAAFCLERGERIEDPKLIRLAIETGSPSLVRTMFVQGAPAKLLEPTIVIDVIEAKVSKENQELVEILLEHQVDPNARQLPPKASHQETALLKAVASRRVDLIERLIKRGAAVNLADQEGWTPLHLAAQMGDLELLALLEKNGASRTVRTKDGKTPLDLANSTQARDALKKKA
jgi:hypothetical protein